MNCCSTLSFLESDPGLCEISSFGFAKDREPEFHFDRIPLQLSRGAKSVAFILPTSLHLINTDIGGNSVESQRMPHLN